MRVDLHAPAVAGDAVTQQQGVASALVQAMDEARLVGTAVVIIECTSDEGYYTTYSARVVPSDQVIVRRSA